eukprot:91376-Pelagomonas_calceolata.AAC.2
MPSGPGTRTYNLNIQLGMTTASTHAAREESCFNPQLSADALTQTCKVKNKQQDALCVQADTLLAAQTAV